MTSLAILHMVIFALDLDLVGYSLRAVKSHPVTEILLANGISTEKAGPFIWVDESHKAIHSLLWSGQFQSGVLLL